MQEPVGGPRGLTLQAQSLVTPVALTSLRGGKAGQMREFCTEAVALGSLVPGWSHPSAVFPVAARAEELMGPPNSWEF